MTGAGEEAGFGPAIIAEISSVTVFFVQLAIAAGYASSIFRQSGALDAAATAPSA